MLVNELGYHLANTIVKKIVDKLQKKMTRNGGQLPATEQPLPTTHTHTHTDNPGIIMRTMRLHNIVLPVG